MSAAMQPPAGIFENAVVDLRDSLTCQICLKLLYEPFTTSCGHTYCYECLNQWFAGNGDGMKKTCPDCRSRIKQQPAPAFLVRQMVEVLCKRNELLPEGESVEEHTRLREEMVSLVDKHKKDTGTRGGLFEGRFAIPDRANALWSSDEGIWRCPECTAELEDYYCHSCDCQFDEEGNPVRNYDDESISISDLSADDFVPTRDQLIHRSMFDTSAVPTQAANFNSISAFGRPHMFHSHMGSVITSTDDDDDESYDRDSDGNQSDLSNLIDDGLISSDVDSEDETGDGELTPRHESPSQVLDEESNYSLDGSQRPGSSDTVREGGGSFSDIEEIPEEEFQSTARSAHAAEEFLRTGFVADDPDFNESIRQYHEIRNNSGFVDTDEDDDDDETGGYNMAGAGFDSDDNEATEEEEGDFAAPASRKRTRIVLDDSDDEPVRAPQRQRTNRSETARGSSSHQMNPSVRNLNNVPATYSRSLVVPGASRTSTSHGSHAQSAANSRSGRFNVPANATASRARQRTQASSDKSSSESPSESENEDLEQESEDDSEEESEEDSEEASDEEPVRAPASQVTYRNTGFQAPRRVTSGHAQPKTYRGSGTQARQSAHRIASRG